jgi:hypothetical protein
VPQHRLVEVVGLGDLQDRGGQRDVRPVGGLVHELGGVGGLGVDEVVGGVPTS